MIVILDYSLIYTITIGVHTEGPLSCNTLFRPIKVNSQEYNVE